MMSRHATISARAPADATPMPRRAEASLPHSHYATDYATLEVIDIFKIYFAIDLASHAMDNIS